MVPLPRVNPLKMTNPNIAHRNPSQCETTLVIDCVPGSVKRCADVLSQPADAFKAMLAEHDNSRQVLPLFVLLASLARSRRRPALAGHDRSASARN
jgi:hypothetical protein